MKFNDRQVFDVRRLEGEDDNRQIRLLIFKDYCMQTLSRIKLNQKQASDFHLWVNQVQILP